MLRNLLLYRFSLFNGAMIALFGYLASKGYVAAAYVADPTGVTALITIMFVLLLGSSAHRIWKTAVALNENKQHKLVAPVKTAKRMAKIKHIHEGAQWLAYLGLIGTVIGFVIALSGLDLGALSTAQGVQAMIPSLMNGMRIALYTTLAGSFYGIWTEVNYRMLGTATECLVEDEKALHP